MTNTEYLKKLESYEQINVIVGIAITRVYVVNYKKYELIHTPLKTFKENGRTFGIIKLYGDTFCAEFEDGEWRVNTKYGRYRM